jgi:hypothetical protein
MDTLGSLGGPGGGRRLLLEVGRGVSLDRKSIGNLRAIEGFGD